MIAFSRAIGAAISLVGIFANPGLRAAEPPTATSWRQSPPWTRDLVIYEIAPKAFTSPNGPESGTFRSLQSRLSYLEDLGVTGIWLTGHSLADPHHFYNIWTQYAVIEPDRIDPTLGTSADFKGLIDDAHAHGIKVFLDVIDHGVTNDSSLLRTHPEWFRGGSWGMADFDYSGGHTDFDDWWVRIWTDYVLRYGVDGFRLDTNTPRPDLWARIRANAFAAGHQIVIFEENNGAIPGVTDFSQQDNRLFYQTLAASGPDESPRIGPYVRDALFANDVASYVARLWGREGEYTAEIHYADGTSDKTGSDGTLHVRRNGLGADKASRRSNDSGPMPDGAPDVELTIDGVRAQSIASIDIHADNGWSWKVGDSARATTDGSPPELHAFIATLSGGGSLLLSCHDMGWEGFPENENPFRAQGSRALFGYSFLFTPMLPIFMSGEEFDADFHALPNLSPNLFGGANPGHGRWLYGAMLDWDELDQPRHRAMYEDVKRMLAIRRQEREVLRANVPDTVEPQLIAVSFRSDIKVPVPYMRWSGHTGVIFAANPDTERDANIRLRIPVEKLQPREHAVYRVTDLWNGGKPSVYSAAQMSDVGVKIRRDNSARGGLAVLKLEAR
jgi:hypothetical protein